MNILYDSIQILFFIGLILSLIYEFKNKTVLSSFLLIYFESSIIVNLISNLFIQWYKHNYVVIQYYDIIYYPLLIILITTQLESKRIIKLLLMFIITFILFSLISNLIIGKLEYPSLSESFGSILYFIATFAYYREVFINEKKEDLSHNGVFWIISSIFIYTAGSFFYNLIFTYLDVYNFPDWFDTLSLVIYYFTSFVTFIGIFMLIKNQHNLTNQI
jgi:hypothetical protein